MIRFNKVGWGNVGLRGKVGLLRFLVETSYLYKLKKSWLYSL